MFSETHVLNCYYMHCDKCSPPSCPCTLADTTVWRIGLQPHPKHQETSRLKSNSGLSVSLMPQHLRRSIRRQAENSQMLANTGWVGIDDLQLHVDLRLWLALRCIQMGVALGRAGGEARHLDSNEHGRVQLPGSRNCAGIWGSAFSAPVFGILCSELGTITASSSSKGGAW